MKRKISLFAGLFCMGFAAAQSADCPADSTDATCVAVRRAALLTQALREQAAATNAQAAAITALNTARFSVPGGDVIKPNLGKADVAAGDEAYFQQWLGSQAVLDAATRAAKTFKCQSYQLSNLIYTANSAAERLRLSNELTDLHTTIEAVSKRLGKPSGIVAFFSSVELSTLGAITQGLATLAGFFVTDYSIVSKLGVEGAGDALALTAFQSVLNGKVTDLEQQTTLSATKIDEELAKVNGALTALRKAIDALPAKTDAEKAALTAAIDFETKARAKLASVFVTPNAGGISPYAQAVRFDSAGPAECVLEVSVPIYGGAQISAVKRFSSGSYRLLATANVRFRVLEAKSGVVRQAGIAVSQCFWNLPTKAQSPGKANCSDAL